MQVGGQYCVHIIFVKQRHKGFSFFGNAFFPWRFPGQEAVPQYVFVHQHHFPFFPGFFHVRLEPGQLILQEIGLKLFHLPHLGIQHNIMHVTVIKRIKLVLVGSRCSFRQLEIMEICLGHPHFPVHGVRFMITHNRRRGNPGDHGTNAGEPFIPLVGMFPVIHQVSHGDEEPGVPVALPGRHGYLFPDFIFGALTVRKNQCLIGVVSIRRVQPVPLAAPVFMPQPVFIFRTGLQVLQGHRVDVGGFPVIGKLVVKAFLLRRNTAFRCGIVCIFLHRFSIRCGRIGLCFANHTVFHKRIFVFRFRLPHDGTRRRTVSRNHLPEIKGVRFRKGDITLLWLSGICICSFVTAAKEQHAKHKG